MNYKTATGHAFTRAVSPEERHAMRRDYEHGFRSSRTVHTTLATGIRAQPWDGKAVAMFHTLPKDEKLGVALRQSWTLEMGTK